MATALGRALASLRRGLQLVASRCILKLIDDRELMQKVQVVVLGDEVHDGVERFQQYGVTSRPKPGAEGVFLSMNGSREQAIVICVDDRRYTLHGLQDGEIALHDDQGQFVKIARDKVHVKSTLAVLIETPTATIQGDLHVTGDTNVDGDVNATGDINDASGTSQSMAAMRTTFNAHTHSAPGVTSGPSTLPIPPPNSPPM